MSRKYGNCYTVEVLYQTGINGSFMEIYGNINRKQSTFSFKRPLNIIWQNIHIFFLYNSSF